MAFKKLVMFFASLTAVEGLRAANANSNSSGGTPNDCKAGCGFKGNPDFNDMCSLCFKKTEEGRKYFEKKETEQRQKAIEKKQKEEAARKLKEEQELLRKAEQQRKREAEQAKTLDTADVSVVVSSTDAVMMPPSSSSSSASSEVVPKKKKKSNPNSTYITKKCRGGCGKKMRLLRDNNKNQAPCGKYYCSSADCAENISTHLMKCEKCKEIEAARAKPNQALGGGEFSKLDKI